MATESKERRELNGDEPSASAVDVAESLQGRLQTCERQRTEYLTLLQRTQADFENYQKRAQRERAEELRFACADLARELLPILDNLQRALGAARRDGEKSSLIEGVSLVQSQLLNVLARFGISPINAAGQPFNPNLHEAILQQPSAEVLPGTIVQILEPGYRFHERVLRPAKVAVAASKDS